MYSKSHMKTKSKAGSRSKARLGKKFVANANSSESPQAQSIRNGLQEAILGYQTGIPGMGQQISEFATVFENLRGQLISNLRQPLNQAYAELGLVKAVVDVPCDDAFRGGIEIKSKMMDPEELEQLHYTMEQENDISHMCQAQKWNRLFGGAGVIILNGDEDLSKPLDLDEIEEGDPIGFRAVDMWELFWDEQNLSDGGALPIQNDHFEYYRYYGRNLHRSRVLISKGIEAPSFIRPRLRGWGLSVIETMIRSMNQYLKATDLTFEVLDEFKIDVYKIKGLVNTLMSPNGTAQIQNRVQLANREKNFRHAITMDSEDDYIQKELSFAGMAETMAQIRMQVAADLRMPMSKLFGIPSTGFSSGEDDLENYDGMVESTIRTPSKFHILQMVKIRCLSLFGYVPEDLQVGFKPLRTLSSEQEENVKTLKYNRVLAAKQAGEMTTKEFRDACNKDQLLPISLDTDEADLDALDEESEDDEGDEADGEKKKTKPKAKAAKKSKTQAKDADS